MRRRFRAEVALRSRTRWWEVELEPETWRGGGEVSRDGFRRLDFEGWDVDVEAEVEGLSGSVIGVEMVRVCALIARKGLRCRSGL